MTNNQKHQKESPTNKVIEFEYFDSDYVGAPQGWLESIVKRLYQEKYTIWRDEKRMSWRGIQHQK